MTKEKQIIIKKEAEIWKKKNYQLTVQPTGSNNLKSYLLHLDQNRYSHFCLYLTTNPFFNCQNFTIGNIQALTEHYDFSTGLFDRFLLLFYYLTGKCQIIIDVKRSIVSNIIFLVTPYVYNKDTDIQKIDYISTNNSKMTLIYIKLNIVFMEELENIYIREMKMDYYDKTRPPVENQEPARIPNQLNTEIIPKTIEEVYTPPTILDNFEIRNYVTTTYGGREVSLTNPSFNIRRTQHRK